MFRVYAVVVMCVLASTALFGGEVEIFGLKPGMTVVEAKQVGRSMTKSSEDGSVARYVFKPSGQNADVEFILATFYKGKLAKLAVVTTSYDSIGVTGQKLAGILNAIAKKVGKADGSVPAGDAFFEVTPLDLLRGQAAMIYWEPSDSLAGKGFHAIAIEVKADKDNGDTYLVVTYEFAAWGVIREAVERERNKVDTTGF